MSFMLDLVRCVSTEELREEWRNGGGGVKAMGRGGVAGTVAGRRAREAV